MQQTQQPSPHHPLESPWTVWTHSHTNPKWDAASYLRIFEMNTVEETVAICDAIVEPFITKSMFYIMRSGILPRWEEPQNMEGGCFSYTISNKNVYDVWKKITYALVGGTISDSDDFGWNRKWNIYFSEEKFLRSENMDEKS